MRLVSDILFDHEYWEPRMASKTVHLHLDIPEGIPDRIKQIVEEQAHETAVLVLWQSGEYSTREAAEELGLTYHDFLDLLADRGIPVEGAQSHLAATEEARQKRKLAASLP
jgi:hypothetical protein